MSRLYHVHSCQKCPLRRAERTPHAGYALDYLCDGMGGKVIAGYVEWQKDDIPVGTFPEWCPLEESKASE